MSIFDELPALSPAQFFALSWDCPRIGKQIQPAAECRIPSTAELLGEEVFADLYMGWNEQGIALEINSNCRTENDSAEIFIDTRDLKSRVHISKYCHHFIFTPDEKDGVFGKEITRFRNEDIHRLSDPAELSVDVESSDSSYILRIRIPAVCLHGYDPLQFQRIGFTYRINRSNAPSQHFAVSSEEFNIEQQPSLWGTVKLIESP